MSDEADLLKGSMIPVLSLGPSCLVQHWVHSGCLVATLLDSFSEGSVQVLVFSQVSVTPFSSTRVIIHPLFLLNES